MKCKLQNGQSTYRTRRFIQALAQFSDRRPAFNRVLQFQPQTIQGFTLIELLTVIVMVGVLAAIASPSWLSLRNQQQLGAAQDQALQALRQAQAKAMSSKQEYQADFREVGQTIQWTVHAANIAPAASDWNSLPSGIQVDAGETTLTRSNGIYRIEFTHRGHINPPLGRLTFGTAGSRAKRCVVLSTILGTMRKASNQATPDEGGRFCY